MKIFAVAVLMAGLSASAVAQQNDQFKTKHSTAEKAPPKAPVQPGKDTTGTSTGANAKDLHTIESQSVRSAPSHSGQPRATKAPAVKPLKDKSSPPIRIAGTPSKTTPLHASANPYNGRLKQKGGGQ